MEVSFKTDGQWAAGLLRWCKSTNTGVLGVLSAGNVAFCIPQQHVCHILKRIQLRLNHLAGTDCKQAKCLQRLHQNPTQ